MKKYNREKRGTYNARINKNIHTGETCEKRNRIKHIRIHIHYDGYDRIEYIPIIYRKTRNNKARIYVGMTNIIRDIFPSIDAPHTQHTYRAIAPYHEFIPQPHNHISYNRHIQYTPRYLRGEYQDTVNEDTRTVKCIIMNDNEEIIYIGMMNRTRTVNITRGIINIELHRNKRDMQAYERAVDPDRIIHGVTVREIKAHDVEIYYI